MKYFAYVPALAAGLLATSTRAEFSAFDTNSDGLVSQAEVEAALAQDFDQGDTNSDGSLSAEELLAWIGVEETQSSLDQASAMLDSIDDDGDGEVQFGDISDDIANHEVKAEQVDTDGDGTVSSSEREAAVASARQDAEERAEDARDRIESELEGARDRIESAD